MHPISDIHLRWAIINGTLQNISLFAHLPYHARPQAFCPVCEQQVILKLGEVRIHHIAHLSNSNCRANYPETALHLNMKFHIAEELERGNQLLVKQACISCSRLRNIVWLADWDEIVTEYQFERIRPDIAILKSGKMIGAIEIYVTNEVNKEKSLYLSSLNIPWIELQGFEEFYQGDKRWLVEHPLDPDRTAPTLNKWECDDCSERSRREAIERVRKAEKRRQQEEYRNNNYTETLCSRLVDFYYPSGKKYREWYFINVKTRNGKKVEAILTTSDSGIVSTLKEPINEETIQELKKAFVTDINRKSSPGTIADFDFMKWRKWEEGHKFHLKDFDQFPFRYEWDELNKKWERTIIASRAFWINTDDSEPPVRPGILAERIQRFNYPELHDLQEDPLKTKMIDGMKFLIRLRTGGNFSFDEFMKLEFKVRERLSELHFVLFNPETNLYRVTEAGLRYIKINQG